MYVSMYVRINMNKSSLDNAVIYLKFINSQLNTVLFAEKNNF